MPDGTNAKYPEPKALESYQLPDIVNHYRIAALNAIRAGKEGLMCFLNCIVFVLFLLIMKL